MTSATVLVDDHLLLRVLLDDEPADLRPSGAAMFTTGLWYHRLCRALAGSVTGSMSRRLGGVDASIASQAIQAVVALPEAVGLVSLRDLAWPMGELVTVRGLRLNLLSLEALAAAEHLGAEICLSSDDDNRPLLEASASRGVAVRVIAAGPS